MKNKLFVIACDQLGLSGVWYEDDFDDEVESAEEALVRIVPEEEWPTGPGEGGIAADVRDIKKLITRCAEALGNSQRR